MKKIKLIKEEDKDHKTLAKEYKRLEIFIIIFMSIAICLGTFYFNVICFGSECENKSPAPLIIIKPGNTATESNNLDVEEDKLPEWAEYLLSQNLTEITYETGALVNDECAASKTMTKEQLTDILTKMTASELKKFDAGGFGGPCWSGIVVKYDDKKFEIFMGKYIIADGNDNNILSLLEKENFKVEEAINPEPLWTYEYNWDTSYIDTLLG